MRRFVALVSLLGACAVAPAHAQSQGIDQIKRDFAQLVYQDSASEINREPPQPLLRAVVVMRIRLNEVGHWAAEVVRDNELEPGLTRKAVASVEHLPAPADMPAELAERLHRDGFMEVWLFQNDSHFALKTLALPQRSH